MATGSQEHTKNDEIEEMEGRKMIFGLTLAENCRPKIEITIKIPNPT